jgi:uncharacterized protein (TIGR02099 family)
MNWSTFRLRALWCWHQLLTLALFVLVLVAVVVGVGRQLLPEVDRYRGDVEAALSARMGMPVRLEALTGNWDGLDLNFRLQGLQLRSPAAPETVLLRVPEVVLRPAFWQSLRHWEPRVDVRLSGLDIHLEQLPDGRVQLRELSSLASSDPHAAEQALRFALRQPALALADSRIHLALNGLPAVTLSRIDFVNRNEGDLHRLAGRLFVPASRDALALQLELRGDPLNWQQSRLQVWMHLPVLKLDSWLPPGDAAGLRLAALTGGGDYWFSFHEGALQSLQTRLDWQELQLEGSHGRHHLEKMQGVLDWQRLPSGWQLTASNLKGRIDNQPWPLPTVVLQARVLQARPEALTVAAAEGDIAGIATLLDDMPLPAGTVAWLHAATPAGRLTNVRADLRLGEDGKWQPTAIEARWRNLALHASDTWPGVKGLAGWLRWTPAQAWLGLETHVAELDLRQEFREPVAVTQLQGHLRLRTDDSHWRVESDQLLAANADAQGSAVLSLDVPRKDPQAARLSLLAGLRDADASSTWRYVPWTAAGDEALSWLRHSILAGRVQSGQFLYDGPLHTRADLGPHRMLMHFSLTGGRLDYSPGWPELRDLDADITIDGRELRVSASSAKLLDASSGKSLLAVIPDLGDPVLQVEGDVSSSGADLMRLFRESPLKAHTAALPEAITLEGPLNGYLRLDIPLQSGDARVDVLAQLKDNRLNIRQAGLVASDLDGSVRFSTARGLEAQRLTARLLEAPVTAVIGSSVHRGTLAGIDVNVNGEASVPALRRWLGSNLIDIASGSTPYQARISIPADTGPVRLQLTSTLAGLRLDLPAPFGKAANEQVPLRYLSTLGSGEQMARLQYGQRLSAGLVWDGSRLDRALLRLDGTAAAWPQQPGIEIEGRMARLDLREWSPWIQRFSRSGSGTVLAQGESPLPTLTRLDLETRDVITDGLRLQNAHIALSRQQAAWQVGVSSDELEGRVTLPDAAAGEIKLSFSRLQWPLPTSPAANAGANSPAATQAANAQAAALNPVAGLGNRPVQINGEGLKLAAWPGLGTVGVSARLLPSPYGLRIEDIVFDAAALDFSGRLDWQWRGGVSTRLRGTASSNNVAALLAAVGYAPNLVSPKASADLDLSWPGGPDHPVLAGLDGRMALTVEQGRLLNVSATTSASRVFGWFDVDNIRRRFKGDFSDVLRKGLSFDKASLSGPIQSGVMTQADFLVDGPTLKADGQGRLDLAHQQMDQQFTVTVPVSSAVPVAAVVVAGPLIGGAVAAAQMAFERQIDKVTQLRYHVSGDWSNPKVERLNMKILDMKAAVDGKPPVAAGSAAAVQPVSNGGKP